MIQDFGISLVRMMENAGRNLAELARLKLGGNVEQHIFEQIEKNE